MNRFYHLIGYALILLLVPVMTYGTRDGSGGYNLPANSFSNPVPGQVLSSTDATAVWADIEAAIAGSVAADGQTTMTGNLKLGGHKLTGLAVGTARTDSITLGQVQDNAVRFAGVAGGTADALTLALSPVVTAYVDGMTIYFVSGASPNTGAATVNVNSVATDAILKNGAALVAGDIAASKVYAITYYNSDWHLWSPVPAYQGNGVHKIWIPAAAMSAHPSVPPAFTVNTATDIPYNTWDFDQTNTEAVYFNLSMPSSWNEGTCTFVPDWTAASSSGGVVWSLQSAARSNDDAIAATLSTTTSSADTLLATGDLHRGPESSAFTIEGTPAANDTVFFVLLRSPANGSDTLAADAKLLGIELFCTFDAAVDVP